MNILIVDDDIEKALWSEDAIKEIDSTHSIQHEMYAVNALREIEENKIDLLILDMQFYWRPGHFDKECGLRVLEELERTDKKIPVIICSSGSCLKELNEYDNVKMFLRYGNLNPEDAYREILKQISV